jgi:hypothetical protein
MKEKIMDRTPPNVNEIDPQDNHAEESEATPLIESAETTGESERSVSRLPQVRSTPTMKVQS